MALAAGSESGSESFVAGGKFIDLEGPVATYKSSSLAGDLCQVVIGERLIDCSKLSSKHSWQVSMERIDMEETSTWSGRKAVGDDEDWFDATTVGIAVTDLFNDETKHSKKKCNSTPFNDESPYYSCLYGSGFLWCSKIYESLGHTTPSVRDYSYNSTFQYTDVIHVSLVPSDDKKTVKVEFAIEKKKSDDSGSELFKVEEWEKLGYEAGKIKPGIVEMTTLPMGQYRLVIEMGTPRTRVKIDSSVSS